MQLLQTLFFNNSVLSKKFNVFVTENFGENSNDKLSVTVKNLVKKYFINTTLTKAYINSKNQYELELRAENIVTIIYANKDRNWLQETKVIEVP